MAQLVAYLRVSTTRQGISGLGMEAQAEAVERYSALAGHEIIATFTEVESGAAKHRPELEKALALCRQRKAVLLIARLDRLSRNLAFVAQLLDSNVEVRAADMPEANRMMIQMLAVFAEHERRLISERTKAALAAAKVRGVILGRNGAELAEGHRTGAKTFAEALRTHVEASQADGARTCREIAEWLNDRGIPARERGRWHAGNVARLLARLG